MAEQRLRLDVQADLTGTLRQEVDAIASSLDRAKGAAGVGVSGGGRGSGRGYRETGGGSFGEQLGGRAWDEFGTMGRAAIGIGAPAAGYAAFAAIAEKASRAINVLSNSTTTLAEKEDELARTVIPLYDKFKGFFDAITGVTEAIRVMKLETERVVGTIKIQGEYESRRMMTEREGRPFISAGAAASTIPFGARITTADLMSYQGRIQYEDAMRVQGAEDALVRARRASAAATLTHAGNQRDFEQSRIRLTAAQRWFDNSSQLFNQTRNRQNAGGPWTRGAMGLLGLRVGENGGLGISPRGPLESAFGPVEGVRDELMLRFSEGQREQSQTNLDTAQRQFNDAQRAARDSEMEQKRKLLEIDKASLAVEQEKLAVMERREQRMGQTQARSGALSEGQWQMGLDALRSLRINGIDAASPETIQLAQSVAPQFVGRLQNQRGINRIQGQLGEFGGVDDFFDYAAGFTQAGQQRDIIAARANISERNNQLETRMATELASIMSKSIETVMRSLVDEMVRQMQALSDRLVTSIRRT